MNNKQEKIHPEVGEDATKYGEVVSSYFAWISLPEKKKKAQELAKMTEKNEEDLSTKEEK